MERIPITRAGLEKLKEEIKRPNGMLLTTGPTGSGKTTQLPKICLSLGRGVAGLIGCTQPRRIAARSVASRVASELESPLGHQYLRQNKKMR